MDDISQILKDHGLFGGFLIGMLVLAWRSSVAVATWATPLLERLINAIVEFVMETRGIQRQVVDAQAKMSARQASAEEDLLLLAGASQADHDRTQRILLLHTEITRRMARGMEYENDVCKHCDEIRRIVADRAGELDQSPLVRRMRNGERSHG